MEHSSNYELGIVSEKQLVWYRWVPVPKFSPDGSKAWLAAPVLLAHAEVTTTELK